MRTIIKRTIKFRGKTKVGEEWVYGYVYETQIFIDGNPCQDVMIIDDFTVIPETVGQFTGLTDKDGKEIYEGDIVVDKSWQNEKPQVVTWERRFLLTYTDGYGVQRYDYTGDVSKKFEVIGNIHDNPELLK